MIAKEKQVVMPEQIIAEKIITEYSYIADDGKEFSNRSDCIEYEKAVDNNRIENQLDFKRIKVEFDYATTFCICMLKDKSDVDLLSKYCQRKFEFLGDAPIVTNFDKYFKPNEKYMVYIKDASFSSSCDDVEWNVKLLSDWVKEYKKELDKMQKNLDIILSK